MILIEPTLSKDQHVAFLSALILALKASYNNEVIEFWSNSRKNEEVRSFLLDYADISGGVIFKDIYFSAKPETASLLRRQVSLLVACWKCFTKKGNQHSGVIFCSTHWPMVIYMFWMKLLSRTRKPSAVIVHDTRSLLYNNKLTGPLVRLNRLNNRVVVLSRDIALNIIKKLNNRLPVKSINLPGIWMIDDIDRVIADEPVKFGFIGDSKKGVQLFYDIAKEVIAKESGVEFWVIGSSSIKEVEEYGDILKGMSVERLSMKEYNSRIESQTYLIFPYSKDRYNYRASATFVDALSFLKPVLSLDNTYISECFRELGDVGYLCENVEDIISKMHTILNSNYSDKYSAQVKTIFKNRSGFSVEDVGVKLRDIITYK
ncbi:MAG: glycosyltransferase [Kiritimatiellae bacterium]|nr:glycosyltransferase [Kiritimatiellia bacterium]